MADQTHVRIVLVDADGNEATVTGHSMVGMVFSDDADAPPMSGLVFGRLSPCEVYRALADMSHRTFVAMNAAGHADCVMDRRH